MAINKQRIFSKNAERKASMFLSSYLLYILARRNDVFNSLFTKAVVFGQKKKKKSMMHENNNNKDRIRSSHFEVKTFRVLNFTKSQASLQE